MSHDYTANIEWRRGGAKFSDNRYSRAHVWRFDGGVQLPASSSPQVVPLPMSDAGAVDPEEALVAATSSCHMLWFLSLAAQRGFVIESYEDQAAASLEQDERGKWVFQRIRLRPRIDFVGRAPSAEELRDLHAAAHAECFIANSLRAEVIVEEAV